ncbi:hypothetical protein [Adlercreutzia shanghongiae]|uniref:DNA-binding protein n=1 Tax=Adlercreutzia shanghongiae TaxID=3111773 RepID=A0ABU6IWD0_9ACTN|nr:hypothetical protein [Adlercreutzia sp. R22]MEC4294119.1 hypothetical protein [Adlercreutzia sp. R22]
MEVALTVALAGALGAPGLAAWADAKGKEAAALGGSVTNEDVPTDDTGVVNTAAREESAGQEAAGKDAAASDGQKPALASQPGDEAEAEEGPINEDVPTDETGVVEGDAEGAEGGEDGESAPASKPARPTLPDPVFGEGVNEDNLVNPQQKPDSSFIYDTAISALQEAESYLNNQTVQVTGEVVGDRIVAEFDPGFYWIVLQGSDKAHSEIPVFMAGDFTELIDTYGAYGRKGTTLQVRGIFHLTCPQHEGLTDLHADAVTFVEKGSITERPFDIGTFMPGIVLVAVGFIMLIVFHRMREGQR